MLTTKYLWMTVAFVGGLILCIVEYFTAKYVLTKKERQYAAFSFVRQFINIAYLVAVFLVAQKMQWDVPLLLIGGAVGVTVPSLFLTLKLVKVAKHNNTERRDDDG